jgi:hypothetical protein
MSKLLEIVYNVEKSSKATVGFNFYSWFQLSSASTISSSGFLRKPHAKIIFLETVFLRIRAPLEIILYLFLRFSNDLV